MRKANYKKNENGFWYPDSYEWKPINYYHKYDDGEDGHISFYPGEVNLGRNYELFDALTNVRGCNYEPIAFMRGVPEDVSEEVYNFYHNYWGCDAHSASWMTLDELKKAYKNKKKYPRDYVEWDGTIKKGWGVGNALKRMYKAIVNMIYSVEYNSKLEDYRIIFWFDS